MSNLLTIMAFFWSSRASGIFCKMFCWSTAITCTNWWSHLRSFRSLKSLRGNRRLYRCRVFSFILTNNCHRLSLYCTGTNFWSDMVLTCSPAASIWVAIVMALLRFKSVSNNSFSLIRWLATFSTNWSSNISSRFDPNSHVAAKSRREVTYCRTVSPGTWIRFLKACHSAVAFLQGTKYAFVHHVTIASSIFIPWFGKV